MPTLYFTEHGPSYISNILNLKTRRHSHTCPAERNVVDPE